MNALSVRIESSELKVKAFLTVPLVFAFLIWVPLCHEASAGEVDHALQLKLNITDSQQREESQHSIILSLVNNEDSALTLVAEWPDDDDKGDYIEYAGTAVRLDTDPEALCPPYSSGSWSNHRALPQPTLTLEPGDSRSFALAPMKKRWLVIGFGEAVYCFPSSGRYEVVARLSVLTSAGSRIQLVSNPQSLVFNRSGSRARPSAAEVAGIDRGNSLVTLNVGSSDGIKAKDEFRILPSKALIYELTVESVSENQSVATVAIRVEERFRKHTNFSEKDWFPQVGDAAYYWSPEWDWEQPNQ